LFFAWSLNMPVYEYYCESCHKIFEDWIKTHDTQTPRECPACGGQARHIISNTSFALKGGGWYATEYGAKKSGESAADSNTNADSASSEENASAAEATADATDNSASAA
jgi:putative FmdB family regulatory protein